MQTFIRAHKLFEFQLNVHWASSFLKLLSQGHFLLVSVNDFVGG